MNKNQLLILLCAVLLASINCSMGQSSLSISHGDDKESSMDSTEVIHLAVETQSGESRLLDNFDEAENIVVFPNPATGQVTVSTKDGTNISSVRIFNMAGSTIIKKGRLRSKKRKIDISDLINGAYFVEVITEDNQRDLQKMMKR